jgi:Zn-dependent M28 family amino/carboxypeptidase
LTPRSTRAPGGDDDGSGITHLLAIARAIYRKKVKFEVDVELVAFAGEEQGLLGSHAYASKMIQFFATQTKSHTTKEQLYEDGADIMLMIQADMLAYHSSEEPMQLGLPDK